jgi:SAM-dependent methyltransferase
MPPTHPLLSTHTTHTTRLANEVRFHDQQAAQRARTFAQQPQRLRFADSDYLDHAVWIRPALAWLGELAGRQVLDLGCGHGMAAVVLARRGAAVTACDISAGYLAEARARAEANGVTVRCVRAAGEALPFADASFDCIWGAAVLHHLDLDRAVPELWRVLKPGGRAVFCEPWGGNPLLALARRWLPYPGKARTPDEQPLHHAHLRRLAETFDRVEYTGYELLGMLGRLGARGRLLGRLRQLDEWLLVRCPRWQRYGRYVVVRLTRAHGCDHAHGCDRDRDRDRAADCA